MCGHGRGNRFRNCSPVQTSIRSKSPRRISIFRFTPRRARARCHTGSSAPPRCRRPCGAESPLISTRSRGDADDVSAVPPDAEADEPGPGGTEGGVLPVPVPDRLFDLDVIAVGLENKFDVAADRLARGGLDLAARVPELLLQLVEGLD